MIDESNPAGRLHKILSLAEQHEEGGAVRDLWETVFGFEQEDDVQLINMVLELYSLSNEIQSLIKMNDQLNHNLYLASFNQINKIFFPLNLNAPAVTVHGLLTDEALTRLQFCAEHLSNFHAEETLSEEDLKQIVEITEALFKSVYTSSLPNALRLSLLEEVERLRNAINMYKIRGAKGLRDALQGTIGAIVVNQEELKSTANDNPDILQRLGELIDKLDSFTTRALKLKKMLTKPISFLLEKATDVKTESDSS